MRRRSEWVGAAAGITGAALITLGYAMAAELPGTDASALDVYAFFLDHRTRIRVAAALTLAGMALLAAFFAILRTRLDPERRDPAAATLLLAGSLAIAAASFSAAALGALAVGAENADPGSSRAILDLAAAVGAAAGPLFAVMLAAAAIAIHRPGSPARSLIAVLALLAAVGCGLWLAPVLTDAGALRAGTLLGGSLGLVGLAAWSAATALWTLRAEPAADRRGRRPAPLH